MDTLVHTVVSQLLQLAEASLVAVVLAIATQLLRKLNLTLTAQQEARLRYYTERAVLSVEETAVTKGADKLQLAAALVKEKAPGVPWDDIQHAIHAEISRQRADAGNTLFEPKADAAPR